jgi:hypothetical protein
LRPGDLISLAAFLIFILLGWLRPLGRRQRYELVYLGLIGTALVFAVRVLSIRSPNAAHVAGDWLPTILILIVYWQSGRFKIAANQKFQGWLERFDQHWIGGLLSQWDRKWSATWVGTYFELSYLLCYVVIPLGVAVLVFTGLERAVDIYWATVLPASFVCYLVIPFATTLPPRLVGERLQPKSKLKSFNLFILRRASIQLNTFPSAHVASSVAGALVLIKLVPLVGIVFLVISFSIAAGAVLGRYHYLPDVILGALLPVVISLASLH